MNEAKLAKAISELMPNVIRGVHLDFFTKRSITQTQFIMLIAVRSYGTCSMSKLAGNMNVSMPTVTGIADRLFRMGLVKRSERPEDRRTVLLSLTAKGESFINAFKKAIEARWSVILKNLNERERENFYQIVTKLLSHLQSEKP